MKKNLKIFWAQKMLLSIVISQIPKASAKSNEKSLNNLKAEFILIVSTTMGKILFSLESLLLCFFCFLLRKQKHEKRVELKKRKRE